MVSSSSGSTGPLPDSMAPEHLHDLATVYREHASFAWRVVRRLGIAPHNVPDVVQDVFLVVHRRLPDYDGRSSMRAWIAGICRGVVRNQKRSRSRRERRLRVLAQTPQDDLAQFDRMELGRALAEGLDALDEDQRLAVVLTDIEGLSPADVAHVTGVSRNTVYSRLRLARRKLRRFLAEAHRDVRSEEVSS